MKKIKDVDKYFLNKKKVINKPNLYKEEKRTCPFCKPAVYEKETFAVSKSGNARWVSNKYPLFDELYQTLIIETDDCVGEYSNYSTEQLRDLLIFTEECTNTLKKEYSNVLAFKNFGISAGGSVPHGHIQLVGVKDTIQTKIDSATFESEIVAENEKWAIGISNFPKVETKEFNFFNKGDTWNLEFCELLIDFFKYIKNTDNNHFNIVFDIENKRLKVIIRGQIESLLAIAYNIFALENRDELKDFINEFTSTRV